MLEDPQEYSKGQHRIAIYFASTELKALRKKFSWETFEVVDFFLDKSTKYLELARLSGIAREDQELKNLESETNRLYGDLTIETKAETERQKNRDHIKTKIKLLAGFRRVQEDFEEIDTSYQEKGDTYFEKHKITLQNLLGRSRQKLRDILESYVQENNIEILQMQLGFLEKDAQFHHGFIRVHEKRKEEIARLEARVADLGKAIASLKATLNPINYYGPMTNPIYPSLKPNSIVNYHGPVASPSPAPKVPTATINFFGPVYNPPPRPRVTNQSATIHYYGPVYSDWVLYSSSKVIFHGPICYPPPPRKVVYVVNQSSAPRSLPRSNPIKRISSSSGGYTGSDGISWKERQMQVSQNSPAPPQPANNFPTNQTRVDRNIDSTGHTWVNWNPDGSVVMSDRSGVNTNLGQANSVSEAEQIADDARFDYYNNG